MAELRRNVKRLEHVGLWVRDVERTCAFYARYFDAAVGDRYTNPGKGFESRFLAFAGGARIEVMKRGDVGPQPGDERIGYAHVALSVGDERAVDALAAQLEAEGHRVISRP